jgi:phage recombination protein Bet
MSTAVARLPTGKNIPTEVWSALKNSLFPGASDESVMMAWDYCAARGLDIMLKPVHLVPMYIKDKTSGQGAMRDVVMPGIGLYRIQADRAGNYAGMSAPVFGPDVTQRLGDADVTYPEWCEISVSKLIADRVVSFTAREYWIENYATAGKDNPKPNTMWLKRPRGQIVKCAEAQALRKAWPELGAQPTAEEMEGKIMERDITPKAEPVRQLHELPEYPQEEFEKNFPKWEVVIESGKKDADFVISMASTKGVLSDEQIERIRSVEA